MDIQELIKGYLADAEQEKLFATTTRGKEAKGHKGSAKAYYDFFIANDELNRQIDSDHKVLFSAEYREKMRELADDGVFLYFLETPDLPLLDKECTSEYILESGRDCCKDVSIF